MSCVTNYILVSKNKISDELEQLNKALRDTTNSDQIFVPDAASICDCSSGHKYPECHIYIAGFNYIGPMTMCEALESVVWDRWTCAEMFCMEQEEEFFKSIWSTR